MVGVFSFGPLLAGLVLFVRSRNLTQIPQYKYPIESGGNAGPDQFNLPVGRTTGLS